MKISPCKLNINFSQSSKEKKKPVSEIKKEYFHIVEDPRTECFETSSGRLMDKDGKFFDGEMHATAPNGKKVHLMYEKGNVISSEANGRLIKTFKNSYSNESVNTPPFLKQITTYLYDNAKNPIGKSVSVHGYYTLGDAAGKIESIKKVDGNKSYYAKYNQDGTLHHKTIEIQNENQSVVEQYDGKNNLINKKILKSNGEYEEMDATKGGIRNYDGSYTVVKGFCKPNTFLGPKLDIRQMSIFNEQGGKTQDIEYQINPDSKVLSIQNYDENGKKGAKLTVDFKTTLGQRKVSYIYKFKTLFYDPKDNFLYREKGENAICRLVLSCEEDGALRAKTSFYSQEDENRDELLHSFPKCHKEQREKIQKQLIELMRIARHNHIQFPFEAHDDYYFNIFDNM